MYQCMTDDLGIRLSGMGQILEHLYLVIFKYFF